MRRTSYNVDIPIRSKAVPNIVLSNVRSVVPKMDELRAVLANNFVDIAVLTESWLTEQISSELIHVNGNNCFRKERNKGQRGGRVLCYVNEDINSDQLKQFDEGNIESLRVLCRHETCDEKSLTLQ